MPRQLYIPDIMKHAGGAPGGTFPYPIVDDTSRELVRLCTDAPYYHFSFLFVLSHHSLVKMGCCFSATPVDGLKGGYFMYVDVRNSDAVLHHCDSSLCRLTSKAMQLGMVDPEEVSSTGAPMTCRAVRLIITSDDYHV